MTPQQTETLAGLEIACRFLYTAFHRAPEPGFLHPLVADRLLAHWPVEDDNPRVQSGLEAMQQFLDEHADNPMPLLKQDYNALFIGPNALLAAPWSSVYLTEEQLTLTEPAMAVREFYRQYGIAINTGENEPDDHIGLQFAFIAHLLGEALQAVDNEQPEQPWLGATAEFLTNHVLIWTGRLFELIRENATTDFYRGLADLAEGSLQQLANLTGAEYLIVRLYR